MQITYNCVLVRRVVSPPAEAHSRVVALDFNCLDASTEILKERRDTDIGPREK